MENFNDDDIVRYLKDCEHIFHLTCIDIWMETNVKCPVCRKDIRELENNYMDNNNDNNNDDNNDNNDNNDDNNDNNDEDNSDYQEYRINENMSIDNNSNNNFREFVF